MPDSTLCMASKRARRRLMTAATSALFAMTCCLPTVRAAVVVDGDVRPIDDIFTLPNEGLPTNGNFLNVNRVVTNPITGEITQFLPQYTWEGINVLTANVNSDLFVGEFDTGIVQINSGSELRFMDLVIGGNPSFADLGPDDAIPDGLGTVEITGPGSLYNNDFTIIPPEVPQQLVNDTGGNISENPRSGEAGAMDGFDLIIGASPGSSGTLSMTAGGRLEIHDSFLVGDARNSFGFATLDGFATVVQTGGCGGFECGEATVEDPKITVVGRLGTGRVDILNAATLISHTTTEPLFGLTEIVGAVIGSRPYIFIGTGDQPGDRENPGVGGTGTVVVDGPGSRWQINGSLQLGGFSQVAPPATDFEGNDATYGARTGVGTLHITNGGIVNILPVDSDINNVKTRVIIGRFGQLVLDDGHLNMANSRSQQSAPGDRGEVSRLVSLVNDGTILLNDTDMPSTSRIDAGLFQNRQLGRVLVGEGQKLTVVSRANLRDISPTDLEFLPLFNYGLIQIDGGEIEFDRGEDDPDDPMPGAPSIVRAFQNRALEAGDPSLLSRRVGEITAASSVLRFRTSLENQGLMRFTGGHNEVFGDVDNLAATVMGDIFPEGVISITGENTSVVFHDILTNGGFIEAEQGFHVGEFVSLPGSTLSLTLGGGESEGEFTHVTAIDDIELMGGTLRVLLRFSGAEPIRPMAGDAYDILSADSSLIGDFDSFDLPDISGRGLGWFPFADTISDVYTLFVLSAAAAIGGDLNADGIVDETDVLIWSANAGNMGGLGDINGDLIVDGADLAIIQMQFGGPGMAPGSGAGLAFGAVPEPTGAGLALMALVGLVALHRRGEATR